MDAFLSATPNEIYIGINYMSDHTDSIMKIANTLHIKEAYLYDK